MSFAAIIDPTTQWISHASFNSTADPPQGDTRDRIASARQRCAGGGSALHGDDTDESDLDLLVEPTEETTLFDIGAIRYEVKKLLGIPVDVLTPGALPDSFKERILKEATPV